MRQAILLLTLSISYLVSNAQLIPNNNLIINGDFEQYIDTPSCIGGLNGLSHWFSPTLASPLYCNKIVNINWPNSNCWASIKNGYDPKSGDGYVLIITYHQSYTPDLYAPRTYLSQLLSIKLQQNEMYCFQIYLRVWGRNGLARITCNNLGALFTDTLISDYSWNTSSSNLPFIPQIETDSTYNFIDTTHWYKFTGKYKANGGESYITIGNFKNNIHSNISIINSSLQSQELEEVVLIIDDVGLYKNECPTETDTTQLPKPILVNTLQVPTGFTPNGDGKNDVFRVLGSPQVSGLTLQVYNRWGERVFGTNNIYEGWDGTYNGQPCPIGTYQWVASYTLLTTGEQKVERGNVTLMR